MPSFGSGRAAELQRSPPFKENHMKQRNICLSITVLGLLAMSASSDQTLPNPASEIREIHKGYFQMLVNEGSDAALEKFYSEDYTYVGVDGKLIDKAGLKERMKSNKLAHSTLTDDLRRVSVFGDVAVLSGHSKSVVSDKGETETSVEGYTEVWVKRDGRWYLVAEQVTPQK